MSLSANVLQIGAVHNLKLNNMTNEEIKTLADGYYAGNADWLNKEQEQDTKVGWRQGFAYALRQFGVIKSVCDHPQTDRGYLQGQLFCYRCQRVIE
jgi:hypothetical protein